MRTVVTNLTSGGARFTRHVRNPNQLDVGLTRSIDSTIVLCQKNLLHATIKASPGKRYNCPANMVVVDAEQRRCVAMHTQLDKPSDAVSARQSTGAADMEQAQKADEQAKSAFIQQSRRFWQHARMEQTPTSFRGPELYHTSKGVTTRPIGNRDLAAQADKHDKEVAELKRVQEEEDGQLALAVDAYEVEYAPLPGAKGDRMDIVGGD